MTEQQQDNRSSRRAEKMSLTFFFPSSKQCLLLCVSYNFFRLSIHVVFCPTSWPTRVVPFRSQTGEIRVFASALLVDSVCLNARASDTEPNLKHLIDKRCLSKWTERRQQLMQICTSFVWINWLSVKVTQHEWVTFFFGRMGFYKLNWCLAFRGLFDWREVTGADQVGWSKRVG